MKRGTINILLICIFLVLIGYAAAASGDEDDLSFNGLFEATIATTQSAPVSLHKMGITSVVSWGSTSAQLDARFSDGTFDSLAASALWTLVGINLNSSLKMNPVEAEFTSWQLGASFSLFDLSFTNMTNLVPVQTKSYTQWSVSGSADDMDFKSSFKFGTCPVEFWEANVCVNWAMFDCDAKMSLCSQFDDEIGFRNITISMKDLLLFEDFLGIHGSFDGVITFTTDKKVFTPTLNLVPSWFFCSNIELMGEVNVTPTLSIAGISFYGLRGKVDVGDGLTFVFAESLSAQKNSSITGKADYWERLGVSGPLPTCCGSIGSFEVNAYFKCDADQSDALFGLGLVTGSFEFPLSDNFTFSVDADLPTGSADWEFAWTIRVVW